MLVTLRDYQQSTVNKIYSSWGGGARNVCAVLPTGAGKSVIMSEVVKNTYESRQRLVFIAHRNELVSQMACHVARRGIPHRIVASNSTVAQIIRKERQLFGESFVNMSAPISVVGIDTLVSREDTLKEWALQQSLWIVDECFPAGTMITVRNGVKKIEDILIGDEVLSFNETDNSFEYEKVRTLFKNPIHPVMVKINTVDGKEITTTCNHPIWTKRGWVKAVDITTKDEVLNEETNNNLCHVRTRVRSRFTFSDRKLFKREQCLLFSRMSFKNVIKDDVENKQKVRFAENVRKKPYDESRCSSKSFEKTERNETQTESARRKRKTFTRSRTKIARYAETIRFYKSNHCMHRSPSLLSYKLQDRCRKQRFENRNRSGRLFTQEFVATRTRQKENGAFNFVRVENIEIFESRNFGKQLGSSVYNFEVNKNNTYIANGIVVHNCHHLLRTNKWGRGVSMFKNAFGLGATATPNRADGQGLSAESDGFFNDIILGPTVRELIERGFLSDYEMVCPKSDLRVDDIKLSADGDWCAKNLKKAAKESRIVGDVVENYKKYASTRKGIVFATDVETAETIARSFNESGIVAAAVSGASNPAWREQSINGFAEGRIQVLVNVDLFDEGFDISDCEVVVMARPTASLGKYLQQIGRALRPAEGKVALVIDHVSNVIRHGLPDKQRAWNLDRREKKAKQLKDPEELELTTCATCLKPYEKFRTVCPYCGNEKPLPDPKSRSIEMVEGDLILLDKAMLDKLRAETVLESPAEIAARVSMAAGSIAGKGVANRQIEKIAAQKELADAIAQWAGVQRAGGLNDREISRKFYHTTGMDVLSALSVSHNRQDYLNMAERVKGWYLCQ